MQRILRRYATFCVMLGALAVMACRQEGEPRILLATWVTPTPPADVDGDGYRPEDGDCDDSNPDIHPGQAEGTASTTTPGQLDGDGVDNDCDGVVDEGTLDHDDDRDGYSERQNDCDDTNGQIHPGHVDGCDGTDNDCDGQVDEDAKDSYEPNDGLDTAYDMGDLTCDYGVVEINLDREGDTDVFRFQVCDAESDPSCDSACLFWVAVQLQAIPEGLEFQVTLFRDQGGTPSEIATLDTQDSGGDMTIELRGSQDADDGGTFFVQVDSGPDNAGISCHDEFRLAMFGQKPVEIPLPGEEASPTPAARVSQPDAAGNLSTAIRGTFVRNSRTRCQSVPRRETEPGWPTRNGVMHDTDAVP